MKKTLLSTLVLVILAACSQQAENTSANNAANPAASGAAAGNLPQTNELNIYNWSNYVDESTVEDFKKANNLDLTYDLYENNETLEAKMLTGKSGYDLGVPGIAFLPELQKHRPRAAETAGTGRPGQPIRRAVLLRREHTGDYRQRQRNPGRKIA